FESGALGTWTSCFAVPYQGPLLRVYGSRATAELYWGHLVERAPNGREKRFQPKNSSFYDELSHFADVVQKGVTPRVPPEEALLDLELCETLVRSAPRDLTKRGRRG